jgi:tetratricopeptide (TPR) repeat protein
MIFGLLFVHWRFSSGQSNGQVDRFINQQEYNSAFEYLDSLDPGNNHPEYVVEKTDLVLQYFVKSIMHKMFALKDLESGESLDNLRDEQGNFVLRSFSPDSVLERLIKRYPDSFILHKALGNYYHEVHLRYRGRWIEPDSTVIEQMIHHNTKAWRNGVYDAYSLYQTGYGFIRKQDYEKAIQFFMRAQKEDPEMAAAYYNLGYAYMNTGKWEEAVHHAKQAYHFYENSSYKGDAARMAGIALSKQGSRLKSIECLQMADSVDPDNYYTLRPLLSHILMADTLPVQSITKRFFYLDPGNPSIYQNLMQAYKNAGRIDELILFFKSISQQEAYSGKVYGNLALFTGMAYYDLEKPLLAKEYFVKAETEFNNIYSSGHQVFNVINSYLSKLK